MANEIKLTVLFTPTMLIPRAFFPCKEHTGLESASTCKLQFVTLTMRLFSMTANFLPDTLKSCYMPV